MNQVLVDNDGAIRTNRIDKNPRFSAAQKISLFRFIVLTLNDV